MGRRSETHVTARETHERNRLQNPQFHSVVVPCKVCTRSKLSLRRASDASNLCALADWLGNIILNFEKDSFVEAMYSTVKKHKKKLACKLLN